MKFLVVIDRVEDPELKIKIRPDATEIDPSGLRYVVNPFDEVALEEALRLRATHGGEVVVVACGPKESAQQLRTALATGADTGILVTTPDVRLDPMAKARALAKVIQTEKPDLVLLGKQAIDDDAGQLGIFLAEMLHWGHASFASKEASLESEQEKSRQPAIQIAGSSVTVVREVDGGFEEVIVQTPAVITTELRLNVPRYPNLQGIMQAKKKQIKELSLQELEIDTTPCLRIINMATPAVRQAGVRVESVDDLLNKLRNQARVL